MKVTSRQQRVKVVEKAAITIELSKDQASWLAQVIGACNTPTVIEMVNTEHSRDVKDHCGGFVSPISKSLEDGFWYTLYDQLTKEFPKI